MTTTFNMFAPDIGSATMPLYEYVCEEDGTRLELIRSMRDCDAPVEDPQGKGRTFHRALSAVMIGRSATGSSLPVAGAAASAGMCGCGRPHGSCGS